jgi:hypothetical protein
MSAAKMHEMDTPVTNNAASINLLALSRNRLSGSP